MKNLFPKYKLKIGASIANVNLIKRLLIDNTVALLFDSILIFISFLKIGVTIP